ncbi:MAG: carboxy terminal-processing peptidase [Ignavibacteriaceae bacterium]
MKPKNILIFSFPLLMVIGFLLSSETIKISADENRDTLKPVEPKPYFAVEEQLVTTILSRYHYNKFKLNDSLSAEIFERYLNTLDPNKMYFISSDIEEFEQYKYEIDNFILENEVGFPYKVFNRYLERIKQRTDHVYSLLSAWFDFTKDEYYQVDRKEEPYPLDSEEADELWRKRIKYEALNLILAGKDSASVTETIKKRYENFRRQVLQYNSEDVFQLFMNAFTESIDPHSNYLSPQSTENFNIDMTLSLEGIGAQLTNEDEYVKIVEIIPGGPASKSGLLDPEDKIIGVAQGEDGEMIDIIGWRVTDAVKLIRGEKGTVVRLSILKAEDGPGAVPKEIKLVRDKIKLEDQAASKSVIEFMHNGQQVKLGVIKIPKFYSDYEAMRRGEKDFKSTTNDVKKLINELRSENIDGLIIDLRNDGGGSLSEAIELAGLFIDEGPVVQVKNSNGSVEVNYDPDPSIFYSGPLAVLVNRFSASASEIFAAAIQDYERGIIVGENTFGKGTVQNLIDLNRLLPSSDNDFGDVKLTIAKFYRINGGSTQHKGVKPDIELPSAFDHGEFGESSQPNALPWDEIKPTEFKKYSDIDPLIPVIKEKHLNRISNEPEFKILLDEIQEFKQRQNKKLISLNEDVRKKEKEAEEKRKFERENARKNLKGLTLIEKGEVVAERKSNDDPILDETARILADFIELSIG